MARTTRTVLAALLAVASTTIAACGAPQSSGPPVAALSSTPGGPRQLPGAEQPASGVPEQATSDSATGATDAAPIDSARPQRRLDDSPEREAALQNAYDQCLLDNGAQPNDARQAAASGAGEGAVVSILEPVPTAATEACLHLLPLLPPELDPALNPQYHDDFVAWVACMRDRGLPVHVSQDTGDPTALSWTYDTGVAQVPGDAAAIESQCQLTAFGGTK